MSCGLTPMTAFSEDNFQKPLHGKNVSRVRDVCMEEEDHACLWTVLLHWAFC